MAALHPPIPSQHLSSFPRSLVPPRRRLSSLHPSPIISQSDQSLGQRIWREYGKAVEKRDLKKALRILETVQILEQPRDSPFVESDENDSPLFASDDDADEDISVPQPQLDLRGLLDTCLNATDMQLVARTYNFLQLRGLLPNFGRYRNITTEASRDITPAAFLEASGLEASKLSPKKWGLTGNSALALGVALMLFNFSVNNGIDVRPFLTSILAFGLLDAVYLGGTGLASILLSWPPYKRRVFTHEAGHVLVAYLLGCPVRGVILDPVQAMRMGIQGQAGTQFWDQTLVDELQEGRLTNASFDRYSMILFAGIAAEAVVYGEAEGGENDENLFKAIVSVIKPPWTTAQISNQARWAVLESFKLLKENRKALDDVISSLYEGESLRVVISKLEASLSGVKSL